jgi:hypothetical protein
LICWFEQGEVQESGGRPKGEEVKTSGTRGRFAEMWQDKAMRAEADNNIDEKAGYEKSGRRQATDALSVPSIF